MTEIELKDILTKWIPAKWKYSDGEMQLIRSHADRANPEAFDKQMAQMFQAREGTGKIAVSFILHALREASNGPRQADMGGCAPDAHWRLTMTLCNALMGQHGAAASLRAWATFLDGARAAGMRFPDHIQARYDAEMRRLMDKADADEMAATAGRDSSTAAEAAKE